jgi:hypothetical protein
VGESKEGSGLVALVNILKVRRRKATDNTRWAFLGSRESLSSDKVTSCAANRKTRESFWRGGRPAAIWLSNWSSRRTRGHGVEF